MRQAPGPIMLRKRREYKRNEKLTRNELEAMQLRKFRQLVAYAQAHAPYYADIIRQRGIEVDRCKPQDFPVMTKTVLMDNFDGIITDRRLSEARLKEFLETSEDPTERFLDEFYVVHTSGSSGEVGIFVFSEQDWARGVPAGSRLEPLPRPFQRKKKRIAFYGATDGHYAGVSFVGTLNSGGRKRFNEAITLDINSPLPDVVDRLNAFQPDSLRGYVTGLKLLAGKQQQGELDIQPRSINAGAEVLTEADRMYLQGVFACPVKNMYAASEHMCMGSSLPGRSRMHLWEDDLIFEINDDHLLVTNLFNYTLPLIRYRMSDVLIPVTDKRTSWPYTEIEAIAGRAENTVKVLNREGREDFISPYTIVVPGIQKFQLQLLSDDHFRFLVYADPTFDASQRQEALGDFRRRIDEISGRKRLDNLRIDVELTDELPVDPKTRKHQMVLDLRDSTDDATAGASAAQVI